MVSSSSSSFRYSLEPIKTTGLRRLEADELVNHDKAVSVKHVLYWQNHAKLPTLLQGVG